MSTIIKLDNICKSFGGLTAVNNLSIDIKENSIHSLIGPNGAGKTTVINLMSGLLKLDKGSISCRNERVDGLPAYKISRKGIARTFQNIKLFNSMSVTENVMVGGHVGSKLGIIRLICNPSTAYKEETCIKNKSLELLNYIGLYDVKNELVKNLPYGKQKKLEIARALMQDPKVLLLDEPAAGLNPSERADLVDLMIKIFNSGVVLFLIEHNMDVVMNISNTITVLNFGAKIAEGSIKEIQNHEEVIVAYLGDRCNPGENT